MTPPSGAFADFPSAAAAVLDHLHRRLGFDLWMITRVAGEEWVILQVEDHGYGVKPGAVFRWADSFCSRMVQKEGPNVSPRCEEVVVYAGAAIGRQVPIGAYIGVPLEREDGSLFGTLCAIHPAAQPEQIVLEQPLVELMARLLSTILNSELKTVDGQRQDERLRAAGNRDAETGAYDADGWRALLAAEEQRCARFGHPACLISLRVAGIDDPSALVKRPGLASLLRDLSGALSSATRPADVVARVAAGEFAVLLVECDRFGANAVVGRINEWMSEQGVDASVGIAHRMSPLTLEDAWRAAARERTPVGE